MKTIIASTAFGVLLALSVSAQETHEKHWDISKIDVSKLPPASDRKDISFDTDIEPLMKASCVRCHGAERPHGGLRLDSKEGILKGGHDGKMVIPGDSKDSLLVAAAAQIDEHTSMPPKHHRRNRPDGPPPGGGGTNAPAGGHDKSGPPPKPLTADEVGVLRAWIDQGAK